MEQYIDLVLYIPYHSVLDLGFDFTDDHDDFPVQSNTQEKESPHHSDSHDANAHDNIPNLNGIQHQTLTHQDAADSDTSSLTPTPPTHVNTTPTITTTSTATTDTTTPSTTSPHHSETPTLTAADTTDTTEAVSADIPNSGQYNPNEYDSPQEPSSSAAAAADLPDSDYSQDYHENDDFSESPPEGLNTDSLLQAMTEGNLFDTFFNECFVTLIYCIAEVSADDIEDELIMDESLSPMEKMYMFNKSDMLIHRYKKFHKNNREK